MSFTYEIRNAKTKADLKKKETDFFNLLRLQKKLNKDYQDAVNQRYNPSVITTVAPVQRSIEEEQQDQVFQLQTLQNNLRKILRPDQVDRAFDRLRSDIRQVIEINNNFEGIIQTLSDQTNIQSDVFVNFVNRYLQTKKPTAQDITNQDMVDQITRLIRSNVEINPKVIKVLADKYTVPQETIKKVLQPLLPPQEATQMPLPSTPRRPRIEPIEQEPTPRESDLDIFDIFEREPAPAPTPVRPRRPRLQPVSPTEVAEELDLLEEFDVDPRNLQSMFVLFPIPTPDQDILDKVMTDLVRLLDVEGMSYLDTVRSKLAPSEEQSQIERDMISQLSWDELDRLRLYLDNFKVGVRDARLQFGDNMVNWQRYFNQIEEAIQRRQDQLIPEPTEVTSEEAQRAIERTEPLTGRIFERGDRSPSQLPGITQAPEFDRPEMGFPMPSRIEGELARPIQEPTGAMRPQPRQPSELPSVREPPIFDKPDLSLEEGIIEEERQRREEQNYEQFLQEMELELQQKEKEEREQSQRLMGREDIEASKRQVREQIEDRIAQRTQELYDSALQTFETEALDEKERKTIANASYRQARQEVWAEFRRLNREEIQLARKLRFGETAEQKQSIQQEYEQRRQEYPERVPTPFLEAEMKRSQKLAEELGIDWEEQLKELMEKPSEVLEKQMRADAEALGLDWDKIKSSGLTDEELDQQLRAMRRSASVSGEPESIPQKTFEDRLREIGFEVVRRGEQTTYRVPKRFHTELSKDEQKDILTILVTEFGIPEVISYMTRFSKENQKLLQEIIDEFETFATPREQSDLRPLLATSQSQEAQAMGSEKPQEVEVPKSPQLTYQQQERIESIKDRDVILQALQIESDSIRRRELAPKYFNQQLNDMIQLAKQNPNDLKNAWVLKELGKNFTFDDRYKSEIKEIISSRPALQRSMAQMVFTPEWRSQGQVKYNRIVDTYNFIKIWKVHEVPLGKAEGEKFLKSQRKRWKEDTFYEDRAVEKELINLDLIERKLKMLWDFESTYKKGRGLVNGQRQCRAYGSGPDKVQQKRQPRRIIGKGIEGKKETYKTFGKYPLYLPALRKGFLHIKYPSFVNIPSLPKKQISDDLKAFIEDILENGKMNRRLYDKLSEEDRKYFNNVAQKCEIDKTLGISDHVDQQNKNDLRRFEMLRGIIVAGNNSPTVLSELKDFIIKFSQEGKITKETATEILADLLTVLSP